MKHARRRPLLTFFILSYILSWVFWLPMISFGSSRILTIAGTFGPAISALLLTALLEGKAGVKNLLKKLLIWRVNPLWYGFSFLSTAVVVWIAIGIYTLSGGNGLQFNDPAQWYLGIVVFLYVLVLSVAGEEIGWRGFALPRLQTSHSALTASLILGILWGFWHLPLFFIPGNFHAEIPVMLFVLQGVALSILMTWQYNNTRGSLLLAHLFHAASNTTLGLFPVLPADTGGSLTPLWLAVGILCLITTLIVLLYGPKSLSQASLIPVRSTLE